MYLEAFAANAAANSVSRCCCIFSLLAGIVTSTSLTVTTVCSVCSFIGGCAAPIKVSSISLLYSKVTNVVLFLIACGTLVCESPKVLLSSFCSVFCPVPSS